MDCPRNAHPLCRISTSERDSGSSLAFGVGTACAFAVLIAWIRSLLCEGELSRSFPSTLVFAFIGFAGAVGLCSSGSRRAKCGDAFLFPGLPGQRERLERQGQCARQNKAKFIFPPVPGSWRRLDLFDGARSWVLLLPGHKAWHHEAPQTFSQVLLYLPSHVNASQWRLGTEETISG